MCSALRMPHSPFLSLSVMGLNAIRPLTLCLSLVLEHVLVNMVAIVSQSMGR